MKLQDKQNLRMMLNMQFKTLWDLVDLVGWTNISKNQQKEYIDLNNRIDKLDKKINSIINDKFGISLYM